MAVLPQAPAPAPPPPFTEGGDGWWLLPADADLLDEEEARDVPAPYPALVTLGTTATTGALILANLAQLPALLLHGEATAITEVCTALALELALTPWAAEADITAIGFGQGLTQLLPAGRIAHFRQPADALREVTEQLLEAHQRPQATLRPHLLLSTTALDTDTARQYAALTTTARHIPLTLIAPAHGAATHLPAAPTLNAALTTAQPAAFLDTDITLQRLHHTAYQRLTATLPPPDPTGPSTDTPRTPTTDTSKAQPPAPDPARTPAHPAANTRRGTSPPAASESAGESVFPALLAAFAAPDLPQPPTQGPGPSGSAAGNPAATGPSREHTAHPTRAPAPPARPTTSGRGKDAARDPGAPEIRVLGPLEVDRVHTGGHGPRIAQLAALLYFRPHHSADTLCADMDPHTPWSTTTLNARLQGLRRALGDDPSGHPYVPRRHTADDPYQLSPHIRCDWTRFLHLTDRAQSLGPDGLPDLEKALSLVRGRPFGTQPLPWAQPLQQEMITRIVDAAHTAARYRTLTSPQHDLTKARHAIAAGLEADDSNEQLYRDWMRIEHAAGNRPGLHTAITRLQHINRTLNCPLEPETERLIHDLLSPAASPHPTPHP
ncbi:hypothetical protein EJ357_46635 [Streptomyces cyaneochromogenes]|uniref:Bacterial transcriptional activator domain-containing protein n=1 Tax=Streptomyces cyaneochromogenes TaxID=2496836 RepID=A0A3Q9EVF8_9ACTN|nr:bacterial transcriptional activator domain-containing protein [Streptomyces cyaneochromogenes]AZQ39968.1 hypothetical protein EJ357_46635 [Streptomyces cyaneochromogenes]